MAAQRWIRVGRIVAPHGVAGLVKILSYGPSSLNRYPRLYDKGGRRSFVLEVRGALEVRGVLEVRGRRGRYHHARIDGVRDRDRAQELAGTDLYVRRQDFPALPEGEYYHADLIGLEVRDGTGRTLGRVEGIENHGAGDIVGVAIKGADGRTRTVDIPFLDDWVGEIHLDSEGEGWMTVSLPRGWAEET